MSLSSTFVAMATVLSFLRVERNDILTQHPLCLRLFELATNTVRGHDCGPYFGHMWHFSLSLMPGVLFIRLLWLSLH